MNIEQFIALDPNEKPLDRMVANGGYCSIFRTIGCIGDSLASGEFESKNDKGEKGYHDFYDYSWGQVMARDTGSKVYNFSRGGMTAKEYMQSFASANGFWEKDKLCQAYIIALGVNDIIGQKQELGDVSDIDKDNYENNKPTFIGYYAQIIQRLKQLQPRAKFFLITLPRYGDENDAISKNFRDRLEELTKFFDRTYLIDLFTYAPAYDKAFCERFFLGHMTPTGYVLSAKMIESYIDYIIRHNEKDFAQAAFIGTDLYYEKED